MEKGESSNIRRVYCYYCQKEGHYSSQCPSKTNEKQAMVNMVTTEVTDIQEVTNGAKGKTIEWEIQEAIRKHATEWIQRANERNATELRRQRKPPEAPIETTDDDSTYQALQECHIMLPLGCLLRLVP